MRILSFLLLAVSKLGFALPPCHVVLAQYGAHQTLRSEEDAPTYGQALGAKYSLFTVSDFTEAELSADGTTAMIITSRGFRLWNVKQKRFVHDLVEVETTFEPVLAARGTQVVGVVRQKGITVWDARSGRQLSQAVPKVAGSLEKVSPDGKTALLVDRMMTPVTAPGTLVDDEFFTQLIRLSAFRASKLYLIDIRTGNVIRRLLDHQSRFRDAYFSPDGKWIVTTTDEGLLRCENVASGEVKFSYGAGGKPDAVEFSPDGNSLFLVARGQGASIINLKGAPSTAPVSTAWGQVYDGAFSPVSNDTLVLWTETGFHVLNRRTDQVKISVVGLQDTTAQFRFSSEGKYFLIYLWDPEIGSRMFVFDGATGNPLYELKTGSLQDMQHVSYAESGGVIGVAFSRDALKIWETAKILTRGSTDAKKFVSEDRKYQFDRAIKADGSIRISAKAR